MPDSTSAPKPSSATTNCDAVSRVASSAGEMSQEYAQHYVVEPAKDIFVLVRDYARDKPDVAVMWCFGLGAIVGWKLRG